MTALAEDDHHPKEKGRCDLQLNNTNYYRKDVNTCDVLCKTLRTCLSCHSSVLVIVSSYSLLLGNSTVTPILVVSALCLAYTAKQKPTPL